MPVPLRYGGAAIGVFAHYGILVVTCLPYWRVSSWQISDPLYGRIPTFDGIWWQCMSLKQGGFTCNNYGTPTLYVDPGIQMCRGLMCVASVLSFAGLFGSLLSVDCSILLGADDTKSKRIVALVSGANFGIAGLCVLASTAWYAWRVTYEFYSPYYQEREFKYDYGPCLYTAWIAMALAWLSGGFLACNCGKKQDKYNTYAYRSPPRPRPTYSPALDRRDVQDNKTEYV